VSSDLSVPESDPGPLSVPSLRPRPSEDGRLGRGEELSEERRGENVYGDGRRGQVAVPGRCPALSSHSLSKHGLSSYTSLKKSNTPAGMPRGGRK
jgi:hypothetical protein